MNSFLVYSTAAKSENNYALRICKPSDQYNIPTGNERPQTDDFFLYL